MHSGLRLEADIDELLYGALPDGRRYFLRPRVPCVVLAYLPCLLCILSQSSDWEDTLNSQGDRDLGRRRAFNKGLSTASAFLDHHCTAVEFGWHSSLFLSSDLILQNAAWKSASHTVPCIVCVSRLSLASNELRDVASS